MMWRRSITAHLTLLFAATSTTVLLVIGALMSIAVERHFEELDLAQLRGKIELARHTLENIRRPADIEALPQKMDDALVGHAGLAIAIVTPDGRTLFATSGANFPPSLIDIPEHLTDRAKPMTWRLGQHSYRGISARVATAMPGTHDYIVAVSADITHHREFMATFQRRLWLSIALGAIVSGLLGWFAAYRGLTPVRNISNVAKGISVSHLKKRLVLDTLPGELVDLAQSFNGMLARLEDAFKRLTDFSSDLAHELRAPVSNLMTQTQVALARVRSSEEYRDVLYSNSEEYERLSRMISEMLFLAKADHGLISPLYELVDLGVEVDRLVEFYEAYTEENAVVLRRHGVGNIYSDRLMIQRALGNLLSNAIRHTAHGGTVTLTIEHLDDAGTRIIVENPGDDIPAQHLPYLFDRFYRVDPSRERSSEGSGLGLAITRSIIETLGGDISVVSGHGRTQFIMTLPEAATREGTDRAVPNRQ